MATIIDSLLITLGLDPSGVKKGAKETGEAQLEKSRTDGAAEPTEKRLEKARTGEVQTPVLRP